MRKKQIIQIWQFVLGWILIGCFAIFVLEESFADFILKYWLFFLIASVSYFYYYSIEYETDEKYDIIRNIVIYGNMYLFVHIFFRPLLNISHELFVLLGLIVVWMWRTTKMKSRWKTILQILWWVFSFLIIVSGMFYLYPDMPDIDWYIGSQKYKIGAYEVMERVDRSDAYLQIKRDGKDEVFDIVPGFSREVVESIQIIYPSLKKSRNEKVMITSPWWDVIVIFPQTEISIEIDKMSNMKLTNLNGRIWFVEWMFSWYVEYEWKRETLSDGERQLVEYIQKNYQNALLEHLHMQVWWWAIIRDNMLMKNINGKLVKLLANAFPTIFGRNLKNYNEFEKYFSMEDNENLNTDRVMENYNGVWVRYLWQSIKGGFWDRWGIYMLKR